MNSQLEAPPTRVIKAPRVGPETRAAVLNLADLAAEARRVVLDARQEAARIVADARAAAEELKTQALKQAHFEGLEQGRQEGLVQGVREGATRGADDAAAEFAQTLELARRILGELRAQKDELLHQARRQMLLFAMELARKIVGHVAAADINAARTNLEKALRLMSGGGEVVVRVSPSQLDQLRSHCEELAATLSLQGVRLEGDDQVAPGGVKLLSRCGEIDATIQTQLANVAASLLGQAHQPLLFDMFVPERQSQASQPIATGHDAV